MIHALPFYFDAALFAALGYAIIQLSMIGRHLMATQADVDTLVVQVVKISDEIKSSAAVLKAELETVKAQLAAANVPAESVNLTALAAAIQAVDDINPDVPPADPVVEPVVEEPVVDPVVDPVEEPVVVEEPVEDSPPF